VRILVGWAPPFVRSCVAVDPSVAETACVRDLRPTVLRPSGTTPARVCAPDLPRAVRCDARLSASQPPLRCGRMVTLIAHYASGDGARFPSCVSTRAARRATVTGDGWTFKMAPGWVAREGARRGELSGNSRDACPRRRVNPAVIERIPREESDRSRSGAPRHCPLTVELGTSASYSEHVDLRSGDV
jgi:hypothetical protein